MKSEEFRRLAAAPVPREEQVHGVVRAADGVCHTTHKVAGPAQALTGDITRVVRFQRLRGVALAVDAVDALCHGNLLELGRLYRNCRQTGRGGMDGRIYESLVSESFV